MMGVLVIGSGASGVQAAAKLLDLGHDVTMLDVGQTSDMADTSLPRAPFSELRGRDSGQARYFLGENLEDIPFENIRTGHKLPPLKRHVIAKQADLPTQEYGRFILHQSQALGGLAMSWGAGAMPLSRRDYDHLPISSDDLAPFYDEVTANIAVSGAPDAFAPELEAPSSIQPPLEMDTAARRLWANYEPKKDRLRARQFLLGRSWLAVASESVNGRDACAYGDMEFWGDADTAVYRPAWTLQALQNNSAFTYCPNVEVVRFEETDTGISVRGRDTKTQDLHTFTGEALMLAAGVPGSARIAMRSHGHIGREFAKPIFTNSYTYIPCLFPAMIGKPPMDRRCSLSQLSSLSLFDGGEEIYSSYFTYRSMLTYKLLKEAPLPFRAGLDAFRLLLPAMMIVSAFHPDHGEGDKRFWLESDEEEHLHFEEPPEVEARRDRGERKLLSHLRSIGLFALKRIHRAPGSSIHYSGTLPMSEDDEPLHTSPYGQLHPYKRVWVADGSSLPIMPAVPPTLTFMAMARRSALHLSLHLKGQT